MTNDDAECVNPYGPESGPHTGSAKYAAVLVTPSQPTGAHRIAPLCLGHAEYEQAWRAAIGAIAAVRIEPHESEHASAG